MNELIKDIIYDIKCGWKSNISLCCILFYTFIYYHPSQTNIFKQKYRKWKNDASYIQCPICKIFNKKANKTKHCDYQNGCFDCRGKE